MARFFALTLFLFISLWAAFGMANTIGPGGEGSTNPASVTLNPNVPKVFPFNDFEETVNRFEATAVEDVKNIAKAVKKEAGEIADILDSMNVTAN